MCGEFQCVEANELRHAEANKKCHVMNKDANNEEENIIKYNESADSWE